MARTFQGEYTTDRDGGRQYTYDGNWELHSRIVSWTARVRSVDNGPWVIDGTINVTQDGDYTAPVLRLVESSIECRVGVE